MSIQQMQQQLINQITAITNEDTLRMLGEELSYTLESQSDLATILSDEDFNGLKMLASEPPDKDTMSLNEFNNLMEQWRMK